MKAIFEEDRNTSMTDEEFDILILSYPLFLVANADNVFDNDEMSFLSIILDNFISSIYGDSINNQEKNALIQNYLDDFKFLSKNESKYKIEFLKLLTSHKDEVKSSIKDLIEEVADISNGISQPEKDMIDYLKGYL
jgi:hypothetical protein